MYICPPSETPNLLEIIIFYLFLGLLYKRCLLAHRCLQSLSALRGLSCVCLFVLGFYGPVNNEVMSSRSVNSGMFLGRLRPSKRLTSTKHGRPRQ